MLMCIPLMLLAMFFVTVGLPLSQVVISNEAIQHRTANALSFCSIVPSVIAIALLFNVAA